MKTVLISSEVTPYSRTGMLADTVAGLAKGLAKKAFDVSVITPMYLNVCTDSENLYSHEDDLTVSAGGATYCFGIYSAVSGGVKFIFVRNDDMFGRRHIYGSGDFDYSDNDIRFGMFCMAALEYMRRNKIRPDIIHCHDWTTGLIPVYRNLYYEDIRSKIVFTAHDISYQGIFSKFSLPALGLPWEVYNIEELEYYEGISLLKGGLVHADYIVVPSPEYCKDIKTEEYSQGMGLLFVDLSAKIEGILGGIDAEKFDPAADRFIPFNYTADNHEEKIKNKSEFLSQTGLKDDGRPLFLIETKFSERKGLELVIDSADTLAGMNANFAFFGYGESYLCTKFKEIANTHDNMFTFIGISETMVHLAYAAADFVIRPSLYEPSGNSHLKGMKYGALPIVSKTGGHINSVTDISSDGGYGFFIEEYSRHALQNQISRAVDFFGNKPILSECIKKVMALDFSWDSAAGKYADLYRRLIGGNHES